MAKKIEIEIVGDASGFQKALGQASNSSSKFGSSLMGLGKAAAIGLGALGAGAAVAGTKMIGLASDAAEVQSKMEVTFGKNLPELTRQIDNFSEATGTSRYAMREQAADMGALLAPILGTKKGAADMSLQFTKLATDLGSFNNIPTGEALEKIRAGLVGEAEPLRSLGVLLTEASTKEYAYANGIAKRGAELSEAQKVEARAGQIMAQTTLAQGDAIRTSDSMANQLKRLKSNVSDTATSLGMELLPAATAVVGGMNDFIARFSEADTVGEKFKVVVQTMGTIAQSAFGLIKTAFNAIDWGAVGTTLANGLRAALDFLSRVDYGGIISRVATAVFGALKSAFNAIDWGAVGDQVGNFVVTALGKLTSFINQVNWNQVGQALVAGMGVAIKALASYMAGLDYPAILGALTRGLIAVLKGLAGLLLGIATAVGKAIIKGIRDGAVSLWGSFKSWLSGLPGQIQGVFSGAGSWLYDEGLAILQGFWDGLRAKWDAVAGWVGGLGSKIKGLKGPESKDATLLVDEGKAIILGLETGMVAQWSTLAPKINALGGHIISNFILGISSKQPEFTGKLADAASAALDAARARVEAQQGRFAEAFGRLGEFAKRAFDQKTQNLLDNVSKKFDAQIAKWQQYADALTPAEKALADLDNEEARRSRESATRAAQDALVAAEAMDQGVEREKAIADAKEQIRQADLANRRAALQATAETERAAREKESAEHIAKLEATKARELQNLEERRSQLATQLDNQLVTLQERLAKHPEEYDKIQKKIQALLKSYGIPMQKSGELMGKAFAKGLDDAADDVKKSAKKLAEIVADYLRLKSPAKKGPLSTIDSWWKPMGPMLARQMAVGAAGPVGVGSARMAGAGAAAPVAAVAGGGTYNFNFPNYVGDRRELATAVRTEFDRINRRN